jgi:hypothetical protein
MTVIDKRPARQRGRGADAARQPSPSALRRSAAIRVAIAVLVGAGVTAAVIASLSGPLNVKADVIGYPIFADFNPYIYSRAYYLIVGLFPIVTLVTFFGLTRIWHRVGLPTPPSRGRLRPEATPGETDTSASPDPEPSIWSTIAAAARVVIVGVVLGLEAGVAFNHLRLSVVLVAVGYSLVVGVGSVALSRLMPERSTWKARVATVNSLGASLTLAGLVLVSAHTEVRILSGNVVHRYPWFPAWLGVPLAVALFGWILVSLRRARPAVIERRAVLLIAAPVALFLLLAHLPADLGQITLFEEGQSVAETMLVGHGWLPWRDVVLTHGLLGDVAPTAVGWGLFGNSYWGAFAGISLIFYPLAVVTTYFLLAYLVGRSWPLLVIAVLIFLGTGLGTTDPRFLLWPVVLLLLAALLKRSTWARAAALGILVVAQAIVTPEMAPGVVIVPAVLAAYEWYWRPAGTPFRQAFDRTIRVAIPVVVASAAFLIYMASRGALGDVYYVTVNLVAGHTLDGAIPFSGVWSGVSNWRLDWVAAAPVAALLISFAYAVVRLRLRRPFLTADWPMAAAALFLLLYYSKFLARMDLPHAYQPFIVATPLMIYIVYRAVSGVEGQIRSRLRQRPAAWMATHPVGIALLILFLVSFWGALHTQVDAARAAYRPVVPVAPAVARVGYASAVDAPAIDDLQRVVNAYLGPHDRLLDITDEPALFYYFLNRGPSLRWYAPNGIVDTAELQRDLLAELRRAPPKLIVFDDTDTTMYGLQAMDGVPVAVRLYLISKWVLAHYRPLLESHGRTIYALPGTPPVSSMHLHLQQQPATVGVRFLGQACSWGDAPTFLGTAAEPPSGAQAVPVRSPGVRAAQVTFTGWAGDRRTGEPAREVIATLNGRIVGRSTPHTNRPDVPAAGYPAGFRRSGFSLSIPTSADASEALRVFAIGRDGSVAQLPILNAPVPAQGGVARIGSRSVALQPGADIGHVDGETASAASLQIEPPAGSAWSNYRWLEVDAPSNGGFVPGPFALSDLPGTADPGHLISFTTLKGSPSHYIIPVASCQQWDGYGSSRLFLTVPAGQQIAGVRLIR